MAVYAIGDIQGCAIPLEELLDKIRFDPTRDRLWLCGDLVNRGPDSLHTLRLIRSLGDRAITVLGNHDLHLLAVSENIRKVRPGDSLKPIFKAPDAPELLNWLRHRPLVHCDRRLQTLMVHAGVYPGWRRRQLVAYAREVEAVLRGPQYAELLSNMYGSEPLRWTPDLSTWARYRFIINSCTRMRYCDLAGNIDFACKGPPGSQPAQLLPWYEHPALKCRKWRIVFGHWSALGHFQAGRLMGLDSGCVWGGRLTAARLDDGTRARFWQVDCANAAD